jgi:hypothetical protein
MQESISKDIDKMIRKIIVPNLQENGFSKIKGRNAWGWHEECIWVFNIKSVGKVHSFITNWPAESLTVSLGIYYTYLFHIKEAKEGENGLLYPKDSECNRRARLTCSYDQFKYTENVDCNSSEKKRRDIWWIQPDGSNINEVINDINHRFLNYAVKWFEDKRNKELALQEAENLKGYIIEKIDQ